MSFFSFVRQEKEHWARLSGEKNLLYKNPLGRNVQKEIF